jgi:hypothetical protein
LRSGLLAADRQIQETTLRDDRMLNLLVDESELNDDTMKFPASKNTNKNLQATDLHEDF